MANATVDQEQQAFAPANFMDPDAFAAGQPDKFIGVIAGVYCYPQVQKNGPKYFGYVGVHIVPDPESGFDPFTQSYFAGGLNKGYPSKDGKTPAGGTHAAYQALAAGNGHLEEKDGPCLDSHFNVIPTHPNVGTCWLGSFAKKMGWDQFCEALRDCDTKGQIDRSKTDSLSALVGVKCRFDRVPQKDDGNSAPKKEGEKEFKTLVPTELISVGNKVEATASPSGAGGSTKANGAASNDDLNALIVAEIMTQLKAAGEDGLTVGTLINSVPKAMIVAGVLEKKQKGYVMGWIGERNKDNNLPSNLVDIDDTTYVPSTDTLSADYVVELNKRRL